MPYLTSAFSLSRQDDNELARTWHVGVDFRRSMSRRRHVSRVRPDILCRAGAGHSERTKPRAERQMFRLGSVLRRDQGRVLQLSTPAAQRALRSRRLQDATATQLSPPEWHALLPGGRGQGAPARQLSPDVLSTHIAVGVGLRTNRITTVMA